MAELFIIEICHRWNAGMDPGSHTVALGPFDNEATATEISARARVNRKSLSGDVLPLHSPGAGARGRWVMRGYPLSYDKDDGRRVVTITPKPLWFGPFEDEAAARDWSERSGNFTLECIVPLLPKLDKWIVERLYSPESWKGKSRG